MAADKTKYLKARIERLFALALKCEDDELKAEAACFACHTRAKDRDYVFSKSRLAEGPAKR